MMMDEYFVRVYHMKDGSAKVPDSIYAEESQAKQDLSHFNNMDFVEYAVIEKRYAKKGTLWSEEQRKAQTQAQNREVLDYMDRLIELSNGGSFYVTDELQSALEYMQKNLGLEK